MLKVKSMLGKKDYKLGIFYGKDPETEELATKFIGHLINDLKFCYACQISKNKIDCIQCRNHLKSHASKIYFYIEVKATSQDFAKMTLPQAKEARDKSDKYALCVVNLNLLEKDDENIEHAVQFVTDIGQKIQDKVNEAEHFKGQHEKIVMDDDIEIEIFDGPIRFKINKSIWNEGKTLEQFKEFIISQMNE